MNHLEIKKFREDNGLTQSQLAEITGVSVRAVQSWEQNQRNIPQSAIKLIESYKLVSNEIIEPAQSVQPGSDMSAIIEANAKIADAVQTIARSNEKLASTNGKLYEDNSKVLNQLTDTIARLEKKIDEKGVAVGAKDVAQKAAHG